MKMNTPNAIVYFSARLPLRNPCLSPCFCGGSRCSFGSSLSLREFCGLQWGEATGVAALSGAAFH